MPTGLGIGLSLSYGGNAGFSPASFPGATAFYLLNEGSGLTLKNSLDTTVPDSNIWYAPESVTSKYTDAKGQATITITGGQTGVNGKPTATRLTYVGGNSAWAQMRNLTLAPGTYTIKLQAKSFDGNAYNFRFVNAGNSTFSPNQTVSSSWQPFTYTFTVSSTTTQFGYAGHNSTLAAFDILVDQIQLVPGNSAPAYNGTGLHARIIPTGTQSWVSRGISVPSANSTLAVALKNTSTTVQDFTLYGSFKISSVGTANYNWLMARDDLGASTHLQATLSSSGSTAQMYSNSTSLTTRLQQPADGLWHVLAVQSNDSGNNGVFKIYLDGILVETLKAANASFTNTAINLFSLPGFVLNNTVGEIGNLFWCEAAHSDSQIRAVSTGMKNLVKAKDNTVSFASWSNGGVVWEGDSLNVNPGVSICFPGLTFPNLPANTISPIFAQHGSLFPGGTYGIGLNLRAPDVILSLNAIPGKKVLHVKCGTNDMPAETTAQFIANYRAYFATILAGCPTARILFDTVMYRGDRPDLHGWCDTVNAQIRADKGTYFYDTPDTAQDANLNYSAGTASYFQGDTIHWSTTGQALANTYIQPKVLAALAAP